MRYGPSGEGNFGKERAGEFWLVKGEGLEVEVGLGFIGLCGSGLEWCIRKSRKVCTRSKKKALA